MNKNIIDKHNVRKVTRDLLLVVLFIAPAHTVFANELPNYSGEAKSVIERVFGSTYSTNVDFEVMPSASGLDTFEVSTENGRLKIKGNNAVSMVSGFNWYLKNKLNQHVSRNGTNLDGGFQLVPMDSSVQV
ncbi:hypothetical protein EKN09_12775, partial [Vibrio penaeicida]